MSPFRMSHRRDIAPGEDSPPCREAFHDRNVVSKLRKGGPGPAGEAPYASGLQEMPRRLPHGAVRTARPRRTARLEGPEEGSQGKKERAAVRLRGVAAPLAQRSHEYSK